MSGWHWSLEHIQELIDLSEHYGEKYQDGRESAKHDLHQCLLDLDALIDDLQSISREYWDVLEGKEEED